LSLYATYQPAAALVRARGYATEQIPGVMSCSAAAASLGVALASGDAPLQILPFGCPDFEARLQLPGGKVILKCGPHLPALCRILERSNLLHRACAVENCGMPEERLIPELRPDIVCGYFTAVIITPEEHPHVSL
ncbi:MAG: precorrin-2 C(20)-methyltransferase, partial [Oscillospiraceae bacterium]|nr:precorrin-2 C(20)-methyltransferase [Oscillospiraceae bacterium]